MNQVLEQLEKSVENISVPESLSPENIRKKLQKEKKRKTISRRHKFEIAAAIALIVAVGGTGIYKGIEKQNSGSHNDAVEMYEQATEKEIADKRERTKTVGDYRLAGSYKDVYDCIAEQDLDRGYIYETVEDATGNGMSAEKNEDAGGDYSSTNVQVEGIDESDFVKCDGNYMYVQTDNKVSVVDIREESMKTVMTVEPDLDADDELVDMYMDNDRLYLIVQERDTEIKGDNKYHTLIEYMVEDIKYMDTSFHVTLQTYDITGRNNAKLLGSVTMDGAYETSRKVGDYVYLFTTKSLWDYTKGNNDGVIPEINGKEIAYNDIYVQNDATSEYIMASVNVNTPDKTVDSMVLVNANMQLYMGTEAIYLYANDYEWNSKEAGSYTDIAKFSYKDGKMDAVGATSVQGTIQDTFAISEAEGMLRILTTDWSKQPTENQLYLLDENLKTVGSLKDIANGEEIYAARYIGDIAYFITYHNTDPLFAVDISNPKRPKMLGEVKMTGFSDYLHPYGENLILGIGYETDPDTGITQGVKMTMFDISDPTDLRIIDSKKLDGDYCYAAGNYKNALVDAKKNIIGFAVSKYDKGTEYTNYYVYQWKKDHFSKCMVEKTSNCYDGEKVRGIYAGERFYLIKPKESGYQIQSYLMESDYKKLDKIKIN